jgi:hypothetical protein
MLLTTWLSSRPRPVPALEPDPVLVEAAIQLALETIRGPQPSSDTLRAVRLISSPVPCLAGDDSLATPTLRRQPSSPVDACAGRRGVGVGQHLTVVDPNPMGQLIRVDFKARRRGRLSFPRPAGGSAA